MSDLEGQAPMRQQRLGEIPSPTSRYSTDSSSTSPPPVPGVHSGAVLVPSSPAVKSQAVDPTVGQNQMVQGAGEPAIPTPPLAPGADGRG